MRIKAVLVVVIAATTAAVVAVQAGNAQGPGARVLTAVQPNGEHTFIDLGRRSKGPFNPTAGDLMIFSAPLLDESNKPLGRSEGYCVVADVSHRGEECSYTFALGDGQITGTGRTVYAHTFSVPVTGGTGAYEGARGSIRFEIGRKRDVVEIRLLP
jgi:allene oxide cyclase-like protein